MSEQKIYCVRMKIPKPILSNYLDWLIPHMKEMIELPCFSDFEYWQREEHEEKTVLLESRYFLAKGYDLKDYLENYSEQMRGDLPEVFRGQIQFARFLVGERSL